MPSLISPGPNNNLIKDTKSQHTVHHGGPVLLPLFYSTSFPSGLIMSVWGAPKKAFPIYTLLLICVDAFRTARGASRRLWLISRAAAPLLPCSLLPTPACHLPGAAFHNVVLAMSKCLPAYLSPFSLSFTLRLCVFYYYDACGGNVDDVSAPLTCTLCSCPKLG